MLPDPYAEDVTSSSTELRCGECGKLLAELVTPPYRIRCARCRHANTSTADS